MLLQYPVLLLNKILRGIDAYTNDAVGLTVEVIIYDLGCRCIERWLRLEKMVDNEHVDMLCRGC